MKKHDFQYFFHEGISNMFSHGFMSFATVGITIACLLIMGTFSLVSLNANANLQSLQDQSVILAFVDESYTEAEAKALQPQIERISNVASVDFIGKEEAMETYVDEYLEDESLAEDITPEIFRDRFSIHLEELESMTETADAIGQIEGIAKVRADEDLSRGFLTVSQIAAVVCITLIVVLLVVSLFIMSNTIKLTTFDRKDEIAIMKMVGATDGFIRWPFVYEGLLLGCFSAVIAFFLQWGLYVGISAGIGASDTLQLLDILPFTELWAPVLGIFVLVGLLVGIVGSLMAIRKFLRV